MDTVSVADLERHAHYIVNRAVNGASTWGAHPTYDTKHSVMRRFAEAFGALTLVRDVQALPLDSRVIAGVDIERLAECQRFYSDTKRRPGDTYRRSVYATESVLH